MKNMLKIFTVLFLTLNIMPVLAVDDSDTTSQSKANRLLTSASSAATGIGGMELAQGLSEQKADKAAEQAMSAYISTMRCSYGNGKSVKAGTEEIELPGGNNANMMKYRTEYTALAADLKERKNALDMTPGIESEEILDKSQMGLYDDENVGITGGRYASLYRAQMLGSESDQAQLDEAKQTSKTRVIGGAVAAGVGVVGGIVGDELINQSLSSSTKTAQTCTESGGTWQGARCHCPDGFIQHTKTGPCFEEKTTEVQTMADQQTQQKPSTPENDDTPVLNSSSNQTTDSADKNSNGSAIIPTNDGRNIANQNTSSKEPEIDNVDPATANYINDPNSDDDVDENIGPEYTKTGVNNLDLFNEDKNQDIATQIGRDILNNPSRTAPTDLANESNTNDYTMINGAPVAKKLNLQTPNTDLAIVTGAGVGAVVASTTGSAPQSNSTQSNSTNDNNVNNYTKASDNAGTAAPQANNSTKTLSATKTNKSDSPDTNISSATKSENPKADEAQSNTSDTKETEQKKVKERPSQNSSKSIPPRANTTNNKTQTSKQSSSNGKKDLKYIYGTFEDAQVTKSQAEQLVKLWAEHTGIKGLTCDKEIRGNIELVCSNSNTDYHFIFEDLTESFSRTQKKSIAMTVCKIFGGKKQTDLNTGLASRIHCEINTNVCNNQLNSALKRFGQKSYMYNVYSSTGNGATKTLSRTYCTIEW